MQVSFTICSAVYLLSFCLPLVMAEIASGKTRDISGGIVGIFARDPVGTAGQTDVQSQPVSQTRREERIMISLGLYEYYVLQGEQNTIKARNLLIDIDDQIIEALKAGPTNAGLWYLLSEVRVRLSPYDIRVYEYLRMSYLAGPGEGWIASRRLAFALQNWSWLDKGNQKHALQDLKFLWDETPYHKYLASVFLKTSRSGRKIIYQHINNGGYEHVMNFENSLKIMGWSSNKPLLYSIITQ